MFLVKTGNIKKISDLEVDIYLQPRNVLVAECTHTMVIKAIVDDWHWKTLLDTKLPNLIL